MSLLFDRFRSIQEKIANTLDRLGRDPASVRIVAVSKTQPIDVLREAVQEKIRLFGENRVQEAEEKIQALHGAAIEWHFIGRLQTNKVNKVVGSFRLIHSVDRPKLVQKLQEEAEKRGQQQEILLQVNLSREETKSGVRLEEFGLLVDSVRHAPNLLCRGLMTIPPPVEDPEESRGYFSCLRELAERHRCDFLAPHSPLELSMGMSQDYLVAVEEGATLVRIGTAIFGPRLDA